MRTTPAADTSPLIEQMQAARTVKRRATAGRLILLLKRGNDPRPGDGPELLTRARELTLTDDQLTELVVGVADLREKLAAEVKAATKVTDRLSAELAEGEVKVKAAICHRHWKTQRLNKSWSVPSSDCRIGK